MNPIRPRYRPEWATLIGGYSFVIALTSLGRYGALSLASYLEGWTLADSMDFVLFVIAPIISTTIPTAIGGFWILARPESARKAVAWIMAAFVVVIILRQIAPLFSGMQPSGLDWSLSHITFLAVTTCSEVLPWVAVLAFLSTGRRRLFFAGESPSLGCATCNYDLKGLVSVRCLECGTEY